MASVLHNAHLCCLAVLLLLLLLYCSSSEEVQHAVQQVVADVAKSTLPLEDVTPGQLQQVRGLKAPQSEAE
jgi:uncharacterized protein YcfL